MVFNNNRVWEYNNLKAAELLSHSGYYEEPAKWESAEVAMNPARIDSPVMPESLRREVLRAELLCRKCGYDLRTLAVGGKCPECGLEIWQTLIREFDPEVSHLPRLASPRGVGNGIVLLLLCVIGIVSLLMVPALVEQLQTWQLLGSNRLQILATSLIPFVAGMLSLIGLGPIWLLRPEKMWRTTFGGGREIFFLTIGIVGSTHANMLPVGLIGGPAWIDLQRILMLALGAVFFWGLRGVFTMIGEHSRSYREAQGGRQGLGAMIAALAGIALGSFLQTWAITLAPRGGNLATIGMVITWISSAMLYLGLIYLFMNACWIRKAIIRPSRTLEELLGKPMPGDGEVDSTPSEN